MRDARWHPDHLPAQVHGPRPERPEFPPAPPGGGRGLKRQLSDAALPSGATATIGGKPICLKQGDRTMCKEFQYNQCKAKDCKKGIHKCAVLLKNGKCCSQTHGAMGCNVRRTLE